MIRSQRMLIAVLLPIIAWLLHVSYCDWAWDRPIQPGSQFVVLGVRDGAPFAGYTARGLMTAGLGSPETGLWLGIILPIALVGVSMFVALGMRHRSRIDKNLCTDCGYDLRGKPGDKCPECGAAIHPSRR